MLHFFPVSSINRTIFGIETDENHHDRLIVYNYQSHHLWN